MQLTTGHEGVHHSDGHRKGETVAVPRWDPLTSGDLLRRLYKFGAWRRDGRGRGAALGFSPRRILNGTFVSQPSEMMERHRQRQKLGDGGDRERGPAI